MKSTDLIANHNFFTCHFAISWLKKETKTTSQKRIRTTWKTIKTFEYLKKVKHNNILLHDDDDKML